MKKLVITIVLLIFSISCKDTDKENLLVIAKGIVAQPERLFDLKGNYPVYYYPQFLHKDLKDSIKLKTLYKYIDTLFIKDTSFLKVDLYPLDKSRYLKWGCNDKDFKINDNFEIYRLDIFKNDRLGFHILFVSDGDNFYLHDIGKLRVIDNWEDIMKYP
ncbi:MAG: hypothetical protein WCT77_09225 [Bacteroidota bacterium]|jgi:hypothetical protein